MKIAFFELCSKKRANFVPLASKPDEYVLCSLPAKIGKFSSKIDLFEFFFQNPYICAPGASIKRLRQRYSTVETDQTLWLGSVQTCTLSALKSSKRGKKGKMILRTCGTCPKSEKKMIFFAIYRCCSIWIYSNFASRMVEKWKFWDFRNLRKIVIQIRLLNVKIWCVFAALVRFKNGGKIPKTAPIGKGYFLRSQTVFVVITIKYTQIVLVNPPMILHV